MSDKPRIGSYTHGEHYPHKLSIYNCDFVEWHDGRVSNMAAPWAVDRGNNGLGSFETYEDALACVREALSK